MGYIEIGITVPLMHAEKHGSRNLAPALEEPTRAPISVNP